MLRTKRRRLFPLFLFACTTLGIQRLEAQCPQVEAVFIDACGNESFNEFIIINSGGGFNTANIELDFDVANNIIGPNNNDINTNNGNLPGAPCGITTGNTAAFTGCSNLIAVGSGVNIPANSIVVMQMSAGSTAGLYNFGSLCGAGQCVYVVSSSCARSAGAFSNGIAAGTRTTNFSIAGGCSQSITYDLAVTSGANGSYYLPLSDGYGNGGCVAPPIPSMAPMPPMINPIANVSTCGSYTLPPITGTNLTANAAYFTGPNGTGTQYLPGDVITMTTTLYAYDHIGPSGCSDQEPFTVTITPGPSVNTPANVTVCEGQPVNVAITGTPGATFSWTNDNTAIGLGASGSGNINFTTANITAQQTGTITITPNLGTCPGTPVSFTITVNAAPTVDDPPNQSVCGGATVSVSFSGTGGGAVTYNWTNTNPSIGLPASGSGDINFTTNNPASSQTGTITVTPTENGCPGAPQNFTITVTPTPIVNTPANITACAGQPVSVPLTGTPGTGYNWTNDNPGIGLTAIGSGGISFTAALTPTQQVGTITVTPILAGCPGTPISFTITVNPGPVMDNPGNQSVCGGDPLAITFTSSSTPNYAWTNSNPAIGLPSSGTGNISFTAANVASTQTANITVTPSEGICAGLPITFTITVTPPANVNQPANITVCGGAVVNANFSGTAGATFNWTNSNTNIGLGASGSGNISFTSANVSSQEVATITVTPVLGSCDGTPKTFTITINPVPVMNDPADQVVCGGENVSVSFSSSSGNPTYAWTNSNPAIGLPATGSGSNINFTSNNSAVTQTATITVTPTQNGCPGTPQTFTITVFPAPSVNQPGNLTICAGQSVLINLSGTPGATLNWTNSNPAIGLPASGTGNINLTGGPVATQQVATITITPTLGGCTGASVSFTITVNPSPTVNQPANVAVCRGTPVFVDFNGNATNFTWTNSNPAIGLPASGSGDLNFISANVAAVQTGTITVTPTAPGNCNGTPVTFTITVFPNPTVSNPGNKIVCSGEVVDVLFAGSAGATFNWTNNNAAIGLGSSGSGDISFVAADVVTPQTATITVTPTANGCTGTSVSFTITINPVPVVDQPGDESVCNGEQVFVDLTGSAGATFSWTNSNTAIGLPASGSGDLNFTAANVASTQVATITVTPSLGNNCVGTALTFTITVSPGASVNNPGNKTACVGDMVNVVFTGSGNPTLTWTNSNPAIGLPATGSGNISFTAANVPAPVTATLVVTPSGASCNGAAQTFTITVGPTPSLTVPNNINACGNVTLNLPFSTSAGASVNWTNSNPAIGLAASGSGNLNFIAANVASPQVATITATPVLGSCTGTPVNFTITVNPAATGNISGDLLLCAGDSTTLTASGGMSYEWDNGLLTPSITVTPDTPTTYVVIITNTFNCATALSVLVDVDQAPVVSLNVNTIFCVGDTAILTASGGGVYAWSTNAGGPSISVIPDSTSTYTVTVTNVFGCTTSASATVGVNQPDSVAIQLLSCNPADTGVVVQQLQNLSGCDSVVITTTTLAPSDSIHLMSLTCNPNLAGVFTQTLSNQFGCDSIIVSTVVFDPAAIDTVLLAANTCDPSLAGTTQVLLAGADGCDSLVITTTTLLPSDTVNLTQSTCNPNLAGVFTQTFSNQAGCDSIIITTVIFDPAAIDTVLLAANTCDPSLAGTTQVLLAGADGCDSLVITTTTLLPSDTIHLTQSTCNPNLAGVFSQSFVNQSGCDSTVITTVLFDPTAIDTTLLNGSTCDPSLAGTTQFLLTGMDGCDSLVIVQTILLPSDTVNQALTTCDPSQVGSTQVLLSNANGCDSLVITTTTLLPGDTTQLTATTCDPSQVGATQVLLSNANGCDSLVITTTTLLPGDTTQLTATTCDASQAGTTQVLLSNANGCDSLVITTTTLLPGDTTQLTATTCDASQAGTTQVLLSNANGCDSLVITTTTLLPSDTVNLTLFTCDSTSAGIFSQSFVNQFGCDSTVISNVLYDPSLIDITFLTDFSCDPSQVGTTQTTFTGVDGCDSLVILTIDLLPSDTLMITSFTCDPSAAGVFTQVLQNQFGCDSVLIAEVIFDPLACGPAVVAAGTNITCGGGSDGSFSLQVQNGQLPLQYNWSGSTGNTGTGQITDLSSPTVVSNLPAGNYSITITDLNNQTTTVVTVSLTQPPVLSLSAAVSSNFNGFALRCANSTDAVLLGSAGGGTPPYQYNWNTTATGPTLSGVGAGTYTVTVSDTNNCSATATAVATAPPALQVSLELERPRCGDSLATATVTGAGGVSPYSVSVDGQAVPGASASFGSGTHLLTLTDANGCSVDSSLSVFLPPVPSISLPPDTTVVLGHSISIQASTNLSTWSQLSWQPLPDTACAGCLLQEWMPFVSQRITVTIQDTFGCSASADIRVFVDRETELYVPNVFSPDDDGVNDIWVVNAGPSVVELNEVQVFDRWGNLQYTWNNPLPPNQWPGWDGTTRGQKAEVGVYVYYIKIKLADGVSGVVKGDVTIVKR